MDLKAWNRIVQPWELCDLRHFCYFILSLLSNTVCYVFVSSSRVKKSKNRLPGHYSETQLHITEGMRPQTQSNLNAQQDTLL